MNDGGRMQGDGAPIYASYTHTTYINVVLLNVIYTVVPCAWP